MLRVKVLQVNGNNVLITDGSKQMSVTRQQLDSKIKDGAITVDTMKVKCLDKQRDKNNNITAYLLCDESGKQMAVTPEQLKNAIYNYQVDCVNLTLTSDNRLVDKDENKVHKVESCKNNSNTNNSSNKTNNNSNTLDDIIDTLKNKYSTNEEIIIDIYMRFLQNEINKADMLHRDSTMFNALVNMLNHCNTSKKLASIISSIGITKIEYLNCTEEDGCSGEIKKTA